MKNIWRAFILSLIMRKAFSLDESESRAEMYQSAKDFYLAGHTVKTQVVHSELQCGLLCSRYDRCQSYNYEHAGSESGRQCELNDRARESVAQDYSVKQGFTYFERVEATCFSGRCLNGATCVTLANAEQYQCLCDVGYTGRHCEQERFGWLSTHPGQSCKHILESGDSKGDGSYWLDPGNKGYPFKAYCDMTTDGGGWLLVANFVLDSSIPSSDDWSEKTTYSGISEYDNNRTGISHVALGQLRAATSFTQLRFHCRKDLGTTFHVTTVKNATGEAVVRFFSGETDILPASCGSYTRMSDDDSSLAKRCKRWGNDGSHYVGKWGHFQQLGKRRMYNHAAFEAKMYHWHIVQGLWLCDDGNIQNLSIGDFWKVYVR